MTVCKISLEWTCCNTDIINNHLNAWRVNLLIDKWTVTFRINNNTESKSKYNLEVTRISYDWAVKDFFFSKQDSGLA